LETGPTLYTLTGREAPRRHYDSPLRRQQVAETRERIVAAGAELLHGFPIWNWRALTIRAVAERADLNERTVYRYFPNERDLRDAVLARFEEEADVHLEKLTLENLGDVTSRILAYVSQFPLEPRTERDATVAAANERQREAIIAAIEPSTRGWPTTDRAAAAAMFDVLWSVVSYEKLVTDWSLEPDDAINGLTWVIELVREAISEGRRPGS
jgi:AcrR family transcriptional regulator